MPQNHHPHEILKFCPRCGEKTFKPQTGKSLECTACGFLFYINEAASVVAVIFNDKGEMLLTVRKHEPEKGMLDLPGGFVDPGESAEQALIREIKEELNLDIYDFSYFGSFPNQYLFGGITYFTLDITFICMVDSLEGIKAGDDVQDYRFIDLKQIEIDQIGLGSIKKVVKELKINFHR